MSVVRDQRGLSAIALVAAVVAIIVLAIIVVRTCLIVVPAGHRGVVFSRTGGVRGKPLGEGLNFVVPLVWSVELFDVRSQTYTCGAQPYAGEIPGGEPVHAKSRDGQEVSMDISVRYALDPEQVPWIYENVGIDIIGRILKPQLRSHARDVVAGYEGVTIFSQKRREIEKQIGELLAQSLAKNHILLEHLLVRRIAFSTEFQSAIERKQIAMQDAQRMQYVLDKMRKQKEERIIRATGESKAIALKGAALAAFPELIRYEYVQSLPEDIKVVIADTRTIINMSDLAPTMEVQSPPARR